MRQLAQPLQEGGNWQQMGATLTRALDVATNDLDRKEILTDLGELLDAQMQQTEQAITYFQRALEVDPQFLPALENLERIYAARGQNRELVDVLQRKVPALKEHGARSRPTKLRDRAALRDEPGRRGDARRRSTARSSTSSRANLQALRGLARVYEVLEQWAELVARPREAARRRHHRARAHRSL